MILLRRSLEHLVKMQDLRALRWKMMTVPISTLVGLSLQSPTRRETDGPKTTPRKSNLKTKIKNVWLANSVRSLPNLRVICFGLLCMSLPSVVRVPIGDSTDDELDIASPD